MNRESSAAPDPVSKPADTASASGLAAGQAAIEAAARRLEAGELVAFPTETVYGLGADAENPAAVAAIYQAKGRPSNHPVIVHLAPGADPGYWSNQIAPTAQHVREEFQDSSLVQCVLDGGQSEVGIESTIVDLTRGTPVLLRPGHVSAAQLAEVLGVWPALPDASAPRASGTLEAHYAPQAAVALVGTERLSSTLGALLQARPCRIPERNRARP